MQPSSCLSDKEEDEIYGFGYGVFAPRVARGALQLQQQMMQQQQQQLLPLVPPSQQQQQLQAGQQQLQPGQQPLPNSANLNLVQQR